MSFYYVEIIEDVLREIDNLLDSKIETSTIYGDDIQYAIILGRINKLRSKWAINYDLVDLNVLSKEYSFMPIQSQINFLTRMFSFNRLDRRAMIKYGVRNLLLYENCNKIQVRQFETLLQYILDKF